MHTRARNDAGFGLVELLIAMTMLNIGILAIVAAFNSGAVALQRAGKIATAATVADSQMELYRALKYAEIALDTTTVGTLTSTNNVYSCDDALKTNTAGACGAANRKTQVTTTCATPLSNQCNPSREVLGADNHKYRVDTYVTAETLKDSSGNTIGREVKKVTIVIRDNLSGTTVADRPLARVASTFDQSTGQ